MTKTKSLQIAAKPVTEIPLTDRQLSLLQNLKANAEQRITAIQQEYDQQLTLVTTAIVNGSPEISASDKVHVEGWESEPPRLKVKIG